MNHKGDTSALKIVVFAVVILIIAVIILFIFSSSFRKQTTSMLSIIGLGNGQSVEECKTTQFKYADQEGTSPGVVISPDKCVPENGCVVQYHLSESGYQGMVCCSKRNPNAKCE